MATLSAQIIVHYETNNELDFSSTDAIGQQMHDRFADIINAMTNEIAAKFTVEFPGEYRDVEWL